ncbi:MAG TPA: hypothetical protein VH012_08480 [Acidimicrobiales bacterium]|nr:hypothetical protein [Acidimicrobiales bacterium]
MVRDLLLILHIRGIEQVQRQEHGAANADLLAELPVRYSAAEQVGTVEAGEKTLVRSGGFR